MFIFYLFYLCNGLLFYCFILYITLFIENKIDKNYGARHAKSFTDLIKSNGILNEVLLILRTKGLFNIIELAKLLPIAIGAQLAGKRPPFFSHSSKNKNQIKKIFKKLEDK